MGMGKPGMLGFHGISMRMGIRSAMLWEWDRNKNKVHGDGN